jgi:hypothetical protein
MASIQLQYDTSPCDIEKWPSFRDRQKVFDLLWEKRQPHATILRRQASHAGSWYTHSKYLSDELRSWMAQAKQDLRHVPNNVAARAIIAPFVILFSSTALCMSQV